MTHVTRLRHAHDEEFEWASYDDETLLEVRLCDLGVRIAGTTIESRIERLYGELEARGIHFRPHCWVSDEWFSPDGIPGIAIPFYLLHPRLARLEERQMLEIEGGPEESCMRILRHEAGHTIDTAFRLSRRRRWQELFGKRSAPYPKNYQPRPYSRSYVHHFDMWYAQSHPAEDFAETFAVWLKPRSGWRRRYEGWPALKKLLYVDELMTETGPTRPQIQCRRQVDPLKSLRKTLREHYTARRQYYGIGQNSFYDNELLRLFSESPQHQNKASAASFLRRHRAELRRHIADWTGQYQYTVDEILGEIIQRCRELNLRVDRAPSRVKQDALVMLTVQIMNYLHDGHHKVVL
ncbi:MAG: putative zinc-binding metallopeptidase [Planctomycetaceae bacterium]|nr:putative zinc-binding metallopeptidase [Planctomycetaceae bacterium]